MPGEGGGGGGFGCPGAAVGGTGDALQKTLHMVLPGKPRGTIQADSGAQRLKKWALRKMSAVHIQVYIYYIYIYISILYARLFPSLVFATTTV